MENSQLLWQASRMEGSVLSLVSWQKICPLWEESDGPSFLPESNSKAQHGFQSKKGFGAKSEWYPGCCAVVWLVWHHVLIWSRCTAWCSTCSCTSGGIHNRSGQICWLRAMERREQPHVKWAGLCFESKVTSLELALGAEHLCKAELTHTQSSAWRQASRLCSRPVELQPSLPQPPCLFIRVGNHRHAGLVVC